MRYLNHLNCIQYRKMNAQQHTGKRIQNYIFNYSDFIGNGNFSKCYKAVNTKTQQQVAIKIVELNSLKSKKLQQLLYSEIEVLKQLNHPNVLRCLQVFTSNRNCYIITQLCDEGDLESVIKKKAKLQERQIRNIVADVYKGLSYMASKNIIHRDLKIANVFLKKGVAKIADFGFAVRSKNSFKDLNIGSPLYMSPEGIISNMYGPKTDVWAFGIMIYELYHGKTPYYQCQREEELKNSVLKQIQWSNLRSDIPNEAKDLIISCLQIREDKRASIYELGSNPYIQASVFNRENKQNLDLRFRSPMKPPSILQTLSHDDNRLSSKTKPRMNYSSQQYTRNLQRGSTPQKVFLSVTSPMNTISSFHTPYTGHHNNRSFSNNEQVNNSTIDGFYQSPQPKRFQPNGQEADKSLNTSINVLTMKSPLLLTEQPLNKTQNSTNNYLRPPYLISTQINFKDSVSILHYCRMIFKYLHLYKEITGLKKTEERQHYGLLGQFELLILDEIYNEIVSKRIKYQGQNPQLRQRKLNEVTEQYRKKYGRELDRDVINSYSRGRQNYYANLTNFKRQIESAILAVPLSEMCTNQQAIVAELLLCIYSSTVIIEECYNKKNYSLFQKNKDVQDILSKKTDYFTYSSYLKRKNKVMIAKNYNLA